MQHLTNSNFDVQIAGLVPPWPDWLSIEPTDVDASVVDIGIRVLSSDINDGLSSEASSMLLPAILGPEASVHAWLYTEAAYRAKVLEEVGESAFKAFSPYVKQRVADGLFRVERVINLQPVSHAEEILEELPGLTAFFWHSSDITRVGLPSTWLTVVGWDDRIGIISNGEATVDFTHCPSFHEMLYTYDLVVIPGGEHHTECLIASWRMPCDTLLEHIVLAVKSLNYRVSTLGMIAGSAYEMVYQRSIREERKTD
ncbi:MAG: hypothetical protein HYX78_10690 [Armatimonadetes bacterium]|nr:hypothetical protein [Armatimonadota bacterium]